MTTRQCLRVFCRASGFALRSRIAPSITVTVSVGASLPSVHVAQRYNLFPNGRTYHPSGIKLASQSIPLNDQMEEHFNSLAKTAHQTNNFTDAVGLYERVLKHRRESKGPTDVSCAATLHNLGRVFIDLKDHRRAEDALAEACAIYDGNNADGKVTLKYADSLGLLALAYRDMEMHLESEAAFKESLNIYKTACYNARSNRWLPDTGRAPDQPNLHPLATVAHLLADAAILFLKQNQMDRAVAFLEEALDIRRWLYGGSDASGKTVRPPTGAQLQHAKRFQPMIAQTLLKLAETKRHLGHLTQAEICINECVDICIDTMGRDAPATAAAFSGKGNILLLKRDFRQAKKAYEEACTAYAVSFGKESPLVASELIHIGRSQELLQDIDGAQKSFEKSIEITAAALGVDHVQVADASAQLAAILMKKGQVDDAIALLRRGIQIRSKKDASDVQLTSMYQRLGDALASKKDPEAEAHFLTAIDLYEQRIKSLKEATTAPTPGQQATRADDRARSPAAAQELLLTDCLDDLGLFYVHFKHFDMAEKRLKESLAVRLRLVGSEHPTVAYSHSNLALLHLARNELTLGISECMKAIETFRALSLSSSSVAGADTTNYDMALADAYTTLGHCYHRRESATIADCNNAIKAHEAALNSRRLLGEFGHLLVAETLHHLCKVLLSKAVVEAKETSTTLAVDGERISVSSKSRAADLLAEAQGIVDRYPTAAQELRESIRVTRASFHHDGSAR